MALNLFSEFLEGLLAHTGDMTLLLMTDRPALVTNAFTFNIGGLSDHLHHTQHITAIEITPPLIRQYRSLNQALYEVVGTLDNILLSDLSEEEGNRNRTVLITVMLDHTTENYDMIELRHWLMQLRSKVVEAYKQLSCVIVFNTPNIEHTSMLEERLISIANKVYSDWSHYSKIPTVGPYETILIKDRAIAVSESLPQLVSMLNS